VVRRTFFLADWGTHLRGFVDALNEFRPSRLLSVVAGVFDRSCILPKTDHALSEHRDRRRVRVDWDTRVTATRFNFDVETLTREQS
jgi:hypothetical protein